MIYRIESRIVGSDGHSSGWSNWSKKYTTIRQALQGLVAFRNGPYNTYTSYYGEERRNISYNHWEYRIIHFYK